MTTSYASGLGSTFGFTAESAVGTFTTSSMRWLRVDHSGGQLQKTIAQSVGLHQGIYMEGARRAFVARDAQLGVTTDLADRQLGLLLKHMLGSSATATQISSSTAYKQVHVPGDTTGLALSVQVGAPMNTGTIQQFNYNGCKVVDWTISVQQGQLAKLDLNFDAWDETIATAYAAPTFLTPGVFDFSQGSLKVGGTPSTTTGVSSISGGAAPTGVVRNVSIKGTNPLKTDRWTIGSTTKKEQLVNNFRTIDIEFELEFANTSDVYSSTFTTDTSLALEVSFSHGDAGSSNPYLFDCVIPSFYINEATPAVEGPDILVQKVKGTVLDNGADNPFQVTYTSKDTAI